MFTRVVLVGALLIASIAYLLSGSNAPQSSPTPYVQGLNKTVLFLANKEHGLCNSHIATASALLEYWPDMDIHFASFAGLESKLQSIPSLVTRSVAFHEINGPPLMPNILAQNMTFDKIRSAPAAAIIPDLMQLLSAPWELDDHMSIYNQVGAVIDRVDPAVIVLDVLFRPAIDATRDKNRLHAVVTPNELVDTHIWFQPYWSMLWKYPAFGSGLGFPVPLSKIPQNIYFSARHLYQTLKGSYITKIAAELRARGVNQQPHFLGLPRQDVPWISMNIEGASVPVEIVPLNVTTAGPIFIDSAPAIEQDAELVAWLARAPTILVNLGTLFAYEEAHATAMATALAQIMAVTEVQVLWKFNKLTVFDDDFFTPLKPYAEKGLVRTPSWLAADPFSLLKTGHIAVWVHHGGSNCYHEAIAAGVPQVALPLWFDHFNYAALVEDINVGVWASKSTTPDWNAPELEAGILQVLGSASIRESAKVLGEKVSAGEKGRDIAAREIAKLAFI